MGMTLAEALASPQVDEILETKTQAAVVAAFGSDEFKSALSDAVKDAAGEIQESLATGTPAALAEEAKTLIEAEELPKGVTDRLLQEYADGGRALNAIEPEITEGKVVKTATEVLQETLAADVKSQREILAEANPTTPFAIAAGGAAKAKKPPVAKSTTFLGGASPTGNRIKSLGMDPSDFGGAKAPEAAQA